jgi:hypothetical protein
MSNERCGPPMSLKGIINLQTVYNITEGTSPCKNRSPLRSHGSRLKKFLNSSLASGDFPASVIYINYILTNLERFGFAIQQK